MRESNTLKELLLEFYSTSFLRELGHHNPKASGPNHAPFVDCLTFLNSPQARVALMSTTACPALTRLSGNMLLYAPYAYGAWLKASKVT